MTLNLCSLDYDTGKIISHFTVLMTTRIRGDVEQSSVSNEDLVIKLFCHDSQKRKIDLERYMNCMKHRNQTSEFTKWSKWWTFLQHYKSSGKLYQESRTLSEFCT